MSASENSRTDEPEEPVEPLPVDLRERLREPAAYPQDGTAGDAVELLQTHISHLFLTPARVYKFRKAVVLPFVSFATRERRDADCLREVALNRRLAPDVYLGVAPLRRGSNGLEIGAVAETLCSNALEHCVVMRRLRAGCDALSLLEARKLELEHVDRLAERIARFHSDAPLHELDTPEREAWYERARQPFIDVVLLARDAGCPDLSREFLDELIEGAEARARALAHCIEARRLEGRGVDGHGDLHLQHVWFERAADPIVMDCVEFRSDLRQIDAASEVACFAMDLRYRGRLDLAERFLSKYAWQRDDFGLYAHGLVDFFAAYRAAVRGGVAAVASHEPEISQEQRSAAARSAGSHLRLADALLRPTSVGGGLVITTGTIGSGKSTAARVTADALDGVVIGSDRTRKSLAGLAPTQRGPEEIYTPQWTATVYAGLLERAESVVGSGRIAVLDATFARRADRERAAAWALERSVPRLLIETHCPPEVVRRRLEQRAHEASESDAGPVLLDSSLARYEPCAEWPRHERIDVDTSADGWRRQLTRAVKGWRAGL